MNSFKSGCYSPSNCYKVEKKNLKILRKKLNFGGRKWCGDVKALTKQDRISLGQGLIYRKEYGF